MKNQKNNDKKEKIICCDCKTKIKIEGIEIKDGSRLVYEDNGEKFEVFKCNDCFKKDPSLKNFRKCEVYSRVVGYLRPVQQWNPSKVQEFKERKEYKIAKA